MNVIMTKALVLVFALISVSAYAVTDADRAIMLSIAKNDFNEFRRLLLDGYDVNSFVENEPEHWVMCDAARPGRIEFLDLAVRNGGDVNRIRPDVGQSYSSPLMCAIVHENREAVKYLISKNADPNIIVCPECEVEHQIRPIAEALLDSQYRIAYDLLNLAEITDVELETMRFMLEDVRSILDDGEAQEKYRLLIAEYLESKGFELNIWTWEKEQAGEWVPTFMRDK